jgi:hypothetical protein
VVTICATSLTFTNCTFCPHGEFMCFVWIWEQMAIISLYGINWLVFITKTECVNCAVRTESVVPVVTICTTSLTFTISTFWPHSVFMLCVDLRTKRLFPYIEEQTDEAWEPLIKGCFFVNLEAVDRKSTFGFVSLLRVETVSPVT